MVGAGRWLRAENLARNKMIEKKTFCVPSSDGIHTLSGYVYLPEKEAKGLFHVVHGMTEHIARYDRLFTDMAKNGWISFGYDNLGHGQTANDDSELGYIARKKGWERLAEDVKVFSDAVRKELGNENMPYVLMGHSMGSFIVRLASQRYVKPDRLIIMGTAGKNPACDPAIFLINTIKLFKGEKHVSRFMDNVAFGSYNKRFGKETESDPKLWLSTLEESRQAYYADKYCMFKFKISAMGDLMRLIKYSNSGAWYKKLPTDFPILLVSGKDDPVGNFGKGILEVEKKLKKRARNVTCKLYEGARHEILNDFCYDEVVNDIIEFCS